MEVDHFAGEPKYPIGDRLDFYLNGLALVRYAEPTLIDLSPENTVLFADATRLAVRFQSLGVSRPGAPPSIAPREHPHTVSLRGG